MTFEIGVKRGREKEIKKRLPVGVYNRRELDGIFDEKIMPESVGIVAYTSDGIGIMIDSGTKVETGGLGPRGRRLEADTRINNVPANSIVEVGRGRYIRLPGRMEAEPDVTLANIHDDIVSRKKR